jgi:hypothetical protein
MTMTIYSQFVIILLKIRKYLHYIFVKCYFCYRMKGSDASWKANNEPPKEFLEFSDDEEERRARRRKRQVSPLLLYTVCCLYNALIFHSFH